LAVCDEPAARIVNPSGVWMNTRNIAALELLALRQSALQAGRHH